jgi:hypothetical protein
MTVVIRQGCAAGSLWELQLVLPTLLGWLPRAPLGKGHLLPLCHPAPCKCMLGMG